MSQALAQGGVDPAKTADAWKQLGELHSKYGELALNGSLAAGGALPVPFGTAVDIVSLGKSVFTADWGGALLDLIGFVPLGGDAAKAAKIANKLSDLRRSLDVATSTLQRSFTRTKEIAAKFWDDIPKKNQKAYDDAIKSCTTKECRDAAAKLKKGPQYNRTPVEGGHWDGERGDGTWIPDDGAPPVKYENGFPDFSPYSKDQVDIPMRGNRTTDFTAADRAMADKLRNPDWERPKGYTWHHHENGTTMQLVPSSINATPHMGGAAMYTGSQSEAF